MYEFYNTHHELASKTESTDMENSPESEPTVGVLRRPHSFFGISFASGWMLEAKEIPLFPREGADVLPAEACPLIFGINAHMQPSTLPFP